MDDKQRVFSTLGALFLIVALAVNPATGFAEEKYVTYFHSGPLTGPGAGATVPFVQGIADFFKEFNDKGGFNGVTIKYIAIDDRYDVARGIAAFQRYRRAHKLIAIHPTHTAMVLTLNPIITKDQVVMFSSGAAGEWAIRPGWIFFLNPPYQDGLGGALDFMLADWKKKGKQGVPKIGYLGWDPAGRNHLNGGQEYAQKIGVKLLQPEFFPPGSLKHDTWLTRIADQGANYLFLQGVDPAQTNVIRDAHALGLTEKITMVSDYFGLLDTLGVRIHPKELEGSYLVSPYIRGDERIQHPFAELWKKYQKKPAEEMDAFYLVGIAQASVVIAALKIALEDVGYDRINGKAFFDAMLKMKGMDPTKGIMGKLHYSPESRRGGRDVKFYQVHGGKLVPVTGWIQTPDCISLGKF